jgi:hypothetical protein
MKKIILLIGILFSLKCYSQIRVDSVDVILSDTQTYDGTVKWRSGKSYILIGTKEILEFSLDKNDSTIQHKTYKILKYNNDDVDGIITYSLSDKNGLLIMKGYVNLALNDGQSHIYFGHVKYIGKLPINSNLIANVEAAH